jgi:hypothetical protein
MNMIASPNALAAMKASAQLYSLWSTNDPARLPMAAAHNVAELEARAFTRRGLHRAALDIARKTRSPATRAVNLWIAAGERRALASTLVALRYWHSILAENRMTWRGM